MFRHLSPKVGIKDKPAQIVKIKQTSINSINSSPIITYKPMKKEFFDKQPARRQKEIKNLGSLLNNQPMINIPASSVSTNKSIQDNKNQTQNNGSIFDDYYENIPKPVVGWQPKQQVSLSGDSYHSENNFNGLKKVNSPKSTVADKFQGKPKNLVNTPINNNADSKMWFKSPNNHQANRSQCEEGKLDKRILSFGGRKLLTGRFMEDADVGSKKSGDSSTGNYVPGSPPDHPQCRFSGLESSEHQQEKRELCNENTSNEEIGKGKALTKHLPKFIANAHIRSTPYLNKYKLDSSNQASADYGTGKLSQPKCQVLQQLQKQPKINKEHEEEKSLSFNREELFLNLKKRQERHSQLSKQLKKMGLHVELKIMTIEGEKPFDLIFIKKISQCKRTSIYLVYHQKTRSLYCLKRTHLMDRRQEYLDNAIREHKIHQFCSHPNIVKTFGSLHDCSHIYLLMEFMEGETLGMELKHQVLKSMSQQNAIKAKLNESMTTKISKINRIRKILFEITMAVAYLHEKGIIHHDIKPDNIFTSHNNYKLGDFGSAALHGSLEYVGTLDYAAPQILMRASYDQKVDIWSVGCIAYQLDVGRPPFFHISPQQTRRLVTNGQYDRSLISDNELKNVIERMLQINRKMRISARQLLNHQFFIKKSDESAIF